MLSLPTDYYNSCLLGLAPKTIPCGHGNEPLDSIKDEAHLDQLSE
jgi:hypothetical protein